MAERKSCPADGGASTSVTAAFLLGWSISETLGLFRKGARPSAPRMRSADYAPRLVVSEGYVERSTDAIVVTVERVVRLYQALGFESDLSSEALTQQVLALPHQVREWLDGKSKEFYSPSELRKLLNDWSLEVWARLSGVSPDSAQAFTAGMSLADTYWYMRPPGRRPHSESERLSQEDWRRLLSKYRLYVEQSRLLRLQGKLPPYVVAVIRWHLQQWGIGTEVTYRDGQLVRVPDSNHREPIKPEDETKIQQALARQILFWNAMLFGFREAATYLEARDRVTIRMARAVGFVLALVSSSALLIAALAGVGYVLIVAVLPLVQPILSPFLAQPIQVSDLISFANLAWTLLVALRLPLLVSVAYNAARRAQKWIDDRLTIRFIAERTYVPWDRYFKG